MAVASVVTGSSRLTATFTETLAAGAAGILPITAESLVAAINQNAAYVNAASGVVNSVDLIYSKVLTVTSGATTINLGTSGGLTDIFGLPITLFGRVRELIIQNLATTSGQDVNVYSSAATAGWIVGLPYVANQLLVPAGGILRLSDPLSYGGTTGLYVPAAAGNFNIKGVAAVTTSVLINVLIAGCSVT